MYLTNPAALEDFGAPGTIVTTGQLYESRGFEAQPRGPRTTLHANYSFTNAEWKDYVIEQQLGERFHARAAWEWYDDYFITQDNRFSGGGYDLLNASLSYRPGSGRLADVTLAFTNLLDEKYFFFFGDQSAVNHAVPGVPFQARLSVDLRF